MGQERVCTDRLLFRLQHYALKAGANQSSIDDMLQLLQSPLGQDVLQLAEGSSLESLLVNDLYKVHMQSMYSQYMTGVTADFALHIRRCPRIKNGSTNASISSTSKNNGSLALADMRDEHPHIFRELTEHICHHIQQLDPLDPRVLAALEEFNNYTPPQAMVDRLKHCGVAPVSWIDLEGAPVAVASGPIEAASNTETTCMQAIQQAIIQAAAEHHRQDLLNQPNQQHQQQHYHHQPPDIGIHAAADRAAPPATAPVIRADPSSSSTILDRTERLACSLGKMVATVEQINALQHDFQILLMAGRRSTDLLHLVFQNLYFMKYARNYVGTSSLLAAALLRPLLERHGLDKQQRQKLVGSIMGTHAHEMTSMIQQLMSGFDAKAGQVCGLQAPVCISQVLAHLLFLTANGGNPGASHRRHSSIDSSSPSSGSSAAATALPDTFTTPYFIRVAELVAPPPEFIEDMATKWGVDMEPSCKVFDLFRVWRLDSGSYSDLAQLLHDTWQHRNALRTAGGLELLQPLVLMHSNLSSVDDIRELTELPSHIRPSMCGFGGLADGFIPLDLNPSETASSPATAAPPVTATHTQHSSQATHEEAVDGASAPAAASVPTWEIVLPTCSLVMKAVQARLTANSKNSNSGGSIGCHLAAQHTSIADSPAGPAATAIASATATASAAEPSTGADAGHVETGTSRGLAGSATTGAPAGSSASEVHQLHAGNTAQHSGPAVPSQECAVKLGDGDLSKAQTDPRLPAEMREKALQRMQQMVAVGVQLREECHAAALSNVLRGAYVAVTRKGLLMLANQAAARRG